MLWQINYEMQNNCVGMEKKMQFKRFCDYWELIEYLSF